MIRLVLVGLLLMVSVAVAGEEKIKAETSSLITIGDFFPGMDVEYEYVLTIEDAKGVVETVVDSVGFFQTEPKYYLKLRINGEVYRIELIKEVGEK